MPIFLGTYRFPTFLALASLIFLTGCQTYTRQTDERDAAVRAGNIAVALARAERDAENHQDGQNAVLYRLEQGAILRAAALANLPPRPPPRSACSTAGNRR